VEDEEYVWLSEPGRVRVRVCACVCVCVQSRRARVRSSAACGVRHGAPCVIFAAAAASCRVVAVSVVLECDDRCGAAACDVPRLAARQRVAFGAWT